MKKVLFKILIAVLLLEVLLFNFKSFRVLSNKGKQEYVPKQFSHIESMEGITRVEIENVNAEVKTVHLKLKDVEKTKYRFFYTDDTNSEFMGTPTKTYVDTVTESKYIPCFLSGKSEKILIEIYDGNAAVESISINEKIPVNFSIMRMIIIYLVILLIYSIKHYEIFENPFSEKNFKQELILLIILAVFLCFTCYLNDNTKHTEEDLYANEFVESIKNGNLYLNIEPSKELLELKNPYSPKERDAAGLERGTDYLWDVALYNGKYYMYFGILPILILMLPYHLITGKFMLSATAIVIFTILSAIMMKSLIKNIFNRYFKDVPFKFMVYSLMVLLCGSQVLVLSGIPRFYEVPIAAGLFFVIGGINFALLAIKKEKVNYIYLFFASLFLSLAVACRPTQLLASLIILPLLIKIFIKNIKEKKDIFKFIASVGIPYLAVGIALMIYNYVRFDSVFEFGAKYQLTINDMSNLKNRFMTIGMGIVCNLFSMPIIVPSFPFLYNHNNLTTFYGYYYIENMIGGLFTLVPICFSIFAIYKIFKNSKSKETFKAILTLTIVASIMSILSSMMAGSMQRYLVDFAWIFILAGIISFIEIYRNYKTQEAKNIMKKIFGILTIYIVIINICAGIVSEKSYMEIHSPREYYKLKYTVNFWE